MADKGPFAWDEEAAARTSIARGKAAAKIKDPAARKAYIARQGKVEMYGGGFAPILRRRFLEYGDNRAAPKSRNGGKRGAKRGMK